MNLDKTIKELTDRLDIVHPYYSAFSSTNNHQNRNDGINYWKGRKIISTKDWNVLYKKNSIYTDTYKITLTSRKPLQYFPDDYNGSLSSSRVIDEIKEEVQQWNNDYYELLEYRKNPKLGRMECSKCLLSGSNDDPIFVGIEKVFARIVANQCNNTVNNQSYRLITYHCNVMNIFSCPFESKEESGNMREESKYSYKREELFALHRISFAIEQAISTFSEITKNNEIIFEVDFKNDRVQDIHTKYNGEPDSWGWNNNLNKILSKVKPISNIVIRDVQDIYSILTNREKLELLFEEYEKNHLDKVEQQKVCCDENTSCVPNANNISNNQKALFSIDTTIDSLGQQEKNQKVQKQEGDDSHNGENGHSKKTEGEELDNENLKLNLKAKIKDVLENSDREQLILLKENKQNIIDFIVDNKDSIKIEDLKIYEPIYKCYREKGHCQFCNIISSIICNNCNRYYNNKEVWLCTNHWQQHEIENHAQ